MPGPFAGGEGRPCRACGTGSSDRGADVVIAYDPDTQITLKNVLLANLNANDFSLNNPI